MSQAISAATPTENVWWGLGGFVESQDVVIGINTMLVAMRRLDTPAAAPAVLRISGMQVGPGLGGGGDLALVIATGVAAPGEFPLVTADSGWSFALRDVVSATSTPKSCIDLARVARSVPMKEIIDFTVKNPSYVGKMGDAVKLFWNSVQVGTGAALRERKLFIFPLVGVGFQLSMTYHCRNRTELLAF